MVECFDRDTTGRFDEEQAADHPFAVVEDEGARHHDRDAETRGVGEKRLVRIVVGELGRQRAVMVEGVNGKQHEKLQVAAWSRPQGAAAPFPIFAPSLAASSKVRQVRCSSAMSKG